jgi:hypothetical protein
MAPARVDAEKVILLLDFLHFFLIFLRDLLLFAPDSCGYLMVLLSSTASMP